MAIITRDQARVNRGTSNDLETTYRELGRWSPDAARMVEPVPQEASDRIDVLLADLEWDARVIRPDWWLAIDSEAEAEEQDAYEWESVNAYLGRREQEGAAEEGGMYGMGYYT